MLKIAWSSKSSALPPLPTLLLLRLLSLLFMVGAQDADMGELAVSVVGKVAGVVADKVVHKVEDSEQPTSCTGPECCHASACMNVPGMRCNTDRGPTKCVGSST